MSASASPNEVISIPAPHSIPSPTATAPSTEVTITQIKVDADLLLQGARAQIWTADILIVAVAVFAVNKLGSIIAAQNRLPPPLPKSFSFNRSTDQ